MTTIDNCVGGASMSGGDDSQKFKAGRRRTHDVEKEHKDLYDKVLEEVLDPAFHRETTQKHNDAYITAAGELKGKRFTDRFEAEEALVDAVIKYRTEAGLPVSNKKEHRHHIYQEVKALLEEVDSGKAGAELKGKIDHVIREGNTYRLLEILHQNELHRNIKAKADYLLNKMIPYDQEPDFYQGILKAHGNNVGRYFKKGELAKLGNRPTIVNALADHYDKEMERVMEEYVGEERTKKGHGKAGGHAAEAQH